jgi:Asp-tRNA(Asn)/Glu-tRNA(Gln) amidotransferase C subunit
MSQHDLTETITHVAAELAAAPLTSAEAARLAPRLADLLTALRALDELDLTGVEPATMLEVGTEAVRD